VTQPPNQPPPVPPQDLLEQWSPVGERMAWHARLGAVLQGSFLLAGVALMLTGMRGGDFFLPCIIFFILGMWGLTLILRGMQIMHRQKGSTIAVLVLSLVLTLISSFAVFMTVYEVVVEHAGLSDDPMSLLILVLLLGMAGSGYVAVWYCIQALRHWPPPLGRGFQVELAKPRDGAEK
jgi:hypothetical protein